jgi:hypothetical protein
MPEKRTPLCESSMPDNSIPRSRLRKYFTWRQVLVNAGFLLYGLLIFFAFDFAYSTVTGGVGDRQAARAANPFYDHGLKANFDGHDFWGDVRYRLITDNLGFKDGSVRDVPLKVNAHRILLIGDSFTEAIGMTFEQSFAGLLTKAGLERPDKTEFLNAGAVSYSPVIYYKKIKYLLERGLQFDEVVVFSDTSDVTDEATSYFCIDDDPKYRAHCGPSEGSQLKGLPPRETDFWVDHFVVTNRARIYLLRLIQPHLGGSRKSISTDHSRIGWVFPGLDVTRDVQPLGVDGGIARSLQNMRALSDMLAARNIPMTVVVYPWAQQIAAGDRDSRQASMWRDFCSGRCKAFIDLYPAFFAAVDADKDWYAHYYIQGDDHFSAAGNRFVFQQIEKQLLP